MSVPTAIIVLPLLVLTKASNFISPDIKQAILVSKVMEALAKQGADINELNMFRKAVSRTKGGKLAMAAYPSKV